MQKHRSHLPTALLTRRHHHRHGQHHHHQDRRRQRHQSGDEYQQQQEKIDQHLQSMLQTRRCQRHSQNAPQQREGTQQKEERHCQQVLERKRLRQLQQVQQQYPKIGKHETSRRLHLEKLVPEQCRYHSHHRRHHQPQSQVPNLQRPSKLQSLLPLPQQQERTRRHSQPPLNPPHEGVLQPRRRRHSHPNLHTHNEEINQQQHRHHSHRQVPLYQSELNHHGRHHDERYLTTALPPAQRSRMELYPQPQPKEKLKEATKSVALQKRRQRSKATYDSLSKVHNQTKIQGDVRPLSKDKNRTKSKQRSLFTSRKLSERMKQAAPSVSETETESGTETEIESEMESGSESESDSEPVPELELEPEFETELEPEPEPELKSKLERDPKLRVKLRSQTQPQSILRSFPQISQQEHLRPHHTPQRSPYQLYNDDPSRQYPSRQSAPSLQPRSKSYTRSQSQQSRPRVQIASTEPWHDDEDANEEDSNGLVEVWAEGVSCGSGVSARAGYGVIAPKCLIRISEPLPGHEQTTNRASVASLHAALELIHGLRSRRAAIHTGDASLITMYHNAPSSPSKPLKRHPSTSTTKAATADMPSRQHDNQTENDETEQILFIRHQLLWRAIAALRDALADRGVALNLNHCRSHPYKMEARLLARKGTFKHVVCALCCRAHGRQFVSHGCRPVCNRGNCREDPRRFATVEDYMRHVYFRHALQCPVSQCEFAALDEGELDDHMQDVHPTFVQRGNLEQGAVRLDERREKQGGRRRRGEEVRDDDDDYDASEDGRITRCPHCRVVLQDEDEIRLHVRRECSLAPMCEECGRGFMTRGDLRAHEARRAHALEHARTTQEDVVRRTTAATANRGNFYHEDNELAESTSAIPHSDDGSLSRSRSEYRAESNYDEGVGFGFPHESTSRNIERDPISGEAVAFTDASGRRWVTGNSPSTRPPPLVPAPTANVISQAPMRRQSFSAAGRFSE